MFKSNLNVEKVHKVMVNHLADYVMNNHLRACVLGISGGIDSTVRIFMEDYVYTYLYQYR